MYYRSTCFERFCQKLFAPEKKTTVDFSTDKLNQTNKKSHHFMLFCFVVVVVDEKNSFKIVQNELPCRASYSYTTDLHFSHCTTKSASFISLLKVRLLLFIRLFLSLFLPFSYSVLWFC